MCEQKAEFGPKKPPYPDTYGQGLFTEHKSQAPLA